ncbi:hypothetical protein B0T22DRAFT_287459 [Podospora appendiculata]|uniref:Uncharacterized protein n=1 Tax=Podospora appendiculata TaxID=314037 RepID=A0AAE0X176_9PEZI|nr:hypothetical protein B0T22DRAFT_287459 [Podospora appendiculata]
MAATATARAIGPLDPLEHLDQLDPLDISLEDFEPSIGSRSRSPPAFDYPSVHSGFRSDEEASEMDDLDSEVSAGGYSPPAWRRLGNGDRSSGFWRKSDDMMGGAGFAGGVDDNYHWRESSAEYESMDEQELILARAARTRLPTGSVSPARGHSPAPSEHNGLARQSNLIRQEQNARGGGLQRRTKGVRRLEDAPKNYFRLALRAQVQQREPVEAVTSFIRSKVGFRTGSWISMLLSAVFLSISYSAIRSLFQPTTTLRPVPDLVKVAGVARSFEPLIYYSENAVSQVGDLQATGLAVWDLSESIRYSDMANAAGIVQELDDLSESLKVLALEVTKFYASVDGDIDGILIVMQWAQRELNQLQHRTTLPLSTAYDNIYNLLSNTGLLDDPVAGQPTRLGAAVVSVFGYASPQRELKTLQRTFSEFLSVLEEAINNELHNSLALFSIFEAIDQRFANLARMVVREASDQDNAHSDLLSSLWTVILGARARDLRKYEKNRLLLLSVREKTVSNKGILVEHNHRLLLLKANLETLRERLVSPLVRSENGSTLSVEQQVRGLEEVADHLEVVRRGQKTKIMEILFGGSAAKRVEGQPGIDG